MQVLNKLGEIAISNDPAEVGETIEMESQRCLPCHGGADERLVRGTLVHRYASGDGSRVLALTKPIENRRECWTAECHAHGSDEKLLGLMNLDVSLAGIDERIVAARLQSAGIAALVVLLIAALTIHSVRRTIVAPLTRFKQRVQRVTQTSGGFLIAVEPTSTSRLISALEAENIPAAARIGEVVGKRDRMMEILE